MEKRGDIAYLKLAREIIEHGNLRDTRNGLTYSIFGKTLEYDLGNNSIPLLTTKCMAFKSIKAELLWMLKGQTDSKLLEKDGVNIWKDNSSKEWIEKNNLTYRTGFSSGGEYVFNGDAYQEGDCGPVYGFQWRNHGGLYQGCQRAGVDFFGCDQLKNVIYLINNDPMSRRMIMTALNPSQENQMALPPCHMTYQFYVDIDENTKEKYLSCKMDQRSADVFLGLPFNIASTAIMVNIIAKLTGCKPKRMIITLGDAHVYKEHLDVMKEQLERENDIKEAPKLNIKDRGQTRVEDFEICDFTLDGYNPHPSLKAKMIV
jgi:thymidylate synthase